MLISYILAIFFAHSSFKFIGSSVIIGLLYAIASITCLLFGNVCYVARYGKEIENDKELKEDFKNEE